MRHFRSFHDLSVEETLHLVELALRLKREHAAGTEQRRLAGRVLGLLFEKPSLRTRASFEAGFAHMGGTSIFMSGVEVGMGKRESVADVARVFSTYVDLLAVRTFSQAVVDGLAEHSRCPIINALTDSQHPCQALADLCTIRERFGRLDDIRLVFVGDGNNVARSLAFAASCCGMRFVLSSPPGFEFSADSLQECHKPDWPGSVTLEPDPAKAVAGADVLYTDVWASMGQEDEQAQRKQAFADYQVNAALMARADRRAVFLHCLPAHRGEEVTAEVIDGPQSMVVEQAANRLHAQKALMLWLLTEAE